MSYIKAKKINNKYFIILIIGIFFIVVSLSFFIYNAYNLKLKNDYDKLLLNDFFKIKDNITTKEDNNLLINNDKSNTTANYFAVLEIPKINLKRGLYSKSNKNNNVNKNIYVLDETTLPNEQSNSHIILAAHSGNSSISFFRKLKFLQLNDEIYFYYENTKYIYKLINKYEVNKTGVINIKQTNNSDITLITCISGTNKQIVLIAEYIKEEKY